MAYRLSLIIWLIRLIVYGMAILYGMYGMYCMTYMTNTVWYVYDIWWQLHTLKHQLLILNLSYNECTVYSVHCTMYTV